MRAHNVSGVPVVEGSRPVGILTSRDIRFEENLDQPVHALMTKELVWVRVHGLFVSRESGRLTQNNLVSLPSCDRRKPVEVCCSTEGFVMLLNLLDLQLEKEL